MKRKPMITLIHEHLQGKHRIVHLSSEGTNDTGNWVHDTELAQFKHFRASTGYIEGLPMGIFTVNEKPQQTLS